MDDNQTFEYYDGPIIYKIKYIKNKFLSITVNKVTFTFYDVHNFFPGSLKHNAKKYLEIDKLDDPVESWEFVKLNDFKKDKMITYCIRDAKITGDLADILIQTCNRFGIYSKSYASEAALAAHYFRMKTDVPRLGAYTRGKKLRAKLAYNAYRGGWVSTFKKGFFNEVYLYDINSSYPDEISRLPDLTRGNFIYRPGPHYPPARATHGWLDVTIDMVNPAPPRHDVFIQPLRHIFKTAGN